MPFLIIALSSSYPIWPNSSITLTFFLPAFHCKGITRTSRDKRSATGAQRAYYRKKRKFELGRQPANTKLGPKRVHTGQLHLLLCSLYMH